MLSEKGLPVLEGCLGVLSCIKGKEGAYLEHDCASTTLLQTMPTVYTHYTCAVSTCRIITDSPTLIILCDVFLNLSNQLHLEACSTKPCLTTRTCRATDLKD